MSSQAFTLAASAARTATAGTNGTTTQIGGFHKRALVLLDVTAATHEAGDKLDVYVDYSPDGSKWLNGAHYTQVLGNGGVKSEVVLFDPTNPGVAAIATTSDCASGVVRPGVWGAFIRARWVIVDEGDGDASFTFSVKAYVQ